MSNSNFNITKVVVDPVSQEIINLEVNGKEIQTGGGNLEEGSESITENGEYTLEPSEGYDGFESVEVTVNVPLPNTLRSVLLTECDSDGEDIEDPRYRMGIATGEMERPGYLIQVQ